MEREPRRLTDKYGLLGVRMLKWVDSGEAFGKAGELRHDIKRGEALTGASNKCELLTGEGSEGSWFGYPTEGDDEK